MPWIEMRLKGQKVLARCEPTGRLIEEGGRVEIRYKPKDGRKYQAGARNLASFDEARIHPDDYCAPAESAPPKSPSPSSVSSRSEGPKKASAAALPEETAGAIVAYADGACSGNPGPAGLGVTLVDGDTRRELSEYLGVATNNVAELTAIMRAAERFAGDARLLEVRTDSQYAIGVLSKGWKAKANTELVAAVKTALTRVKWKLVYVPGHAGVPGNERADELARAAIVARANSGWTQRPMSNRPKSG